MYLVSVIIPTHNRCAVLRRTLDSLNRQTFPLNAVEVVVVADGCSDGTLEMLSHYQADFTLRFIEQPGQGPAAARNAGAAKATGQLLIFLDDNIKAALSLIEGHVMVHRQKPGGVVIGYLPPVLEHQTGFFRCTLQNWWENMFEAMREVGHRYAYTDLLSGNFSLAAELFQRMGGFNPSLYYHEDYELGVRLHKAGVPFTFAPNALGYHHEITDVNRALHRKYQEGQADVQLGYLHPELRSTLLLARLHSHSLLPTRIMRIFAFWWPSAGDALVRFFQAGLWLLEWTRMRGLWRRIMFGLLAYWYWRGVTQELKSPQAVAEFLETEPNQANVDEEAEIELDLCLGLEAAERLLDDARPASVVVRYGSQIVGHIDPQPGAERLRGVHLRRILATSLFVRLLKAIALAEVIDVPTDIDRLLAACDEMLELQGRYEAGYV